MKFKDYLKEIQDKGGNGFINKDKIALTRCPECKKENYALNILLGICTWCGYDANEEEQNDL
jgi:ssDNA-binding Zn-finger/Zn-ribbon topoisomerase 1